jgi:23S rRNA pseudouridine2605 synthase
VRLQTEPQLPRVLIYHKLEGEIVSQDDPEKRASVFDKLPHIRGAKWVSIGRLDINTSGLIMFTTSGELANHFMHPRYEVEREYAVRVMGELSEGQMLQLTQGIELDDGVAAFDVIQDRGGEGSNHWYQVVLREGKNREVRRLFEALSFMVSRLMRVRFGPVSLPPRLKRGQMLALEDKEVRELLEWAELPVPRAQQRPLTAREKEQAGKPFTPKSTAAAVAAAPEPKPKQARKPGWAKAFNPTTKQRRSDRNRGRG